MVRAIFALEIELEPSPGMHSATVIVWLNCAGPPDRGYIVRGGRPVNPSGQHA